MGVPKFFQERMRKTSLPSSKAEDIEGKAEHDVPTLQSARSIGIVGFAALAMVLNISGVSSMSISLPSIGRDLNIDPNSLQWLVTAYSLTSGCFLLLLGRLADIWGRKHVFMAGAAWLVVFTIGCGVAQNAITIILMRAFSGLGPAAMVPASLGILAKTFPPSHARSIAFATFSAGAPIGSAFGLVLGGVLTEYAPVTWRAVFFVMAGIAALALFGAFMCFPPDDGSGGDDRRVDWIGGLLITTGLILFTFCLGEGEIAPQGWNTPYIIALLIISLLAIGSFIGWEHHVETQTSRPPLMRLTIFTRARGKFAAIQAIGFLAWSAFATFSFWGTLYYQDYLGLPPIQTVLRFLPMSITGFGVNVVFALVAGRVSGQILIIIGCVGTGLANLLFALINTSSPYWAYGFPAAIVSVFGADFIFASSTLFGARVALPHEQSLAGGIFNTVTQIGTAFGMTITTIVFDKTVQKESAQLGVQLNQYATNAPPSAVLKGYRTAQWTSFAFAMFALLVATVLLRGIGVIGGVGPKKEADLSENDEKTTSLDPMTIEKAAPDEAMDSSSPEISAVVDAAPSASENSATAAVKEPAPIPI